MNEVLRISPVNNSIVNQRLPTVDSIHKGFIPFARRIVVEMIKAIINSRIENVNVFIWDNAWVYRNEVFTNFFYGWLNAKIISKRS